MEELDLFDFDFSAPKECEIEVKKGLLRQAVLGFLAEQAPDAIAANVPIKRRTYRVAAAAFWLDKSCRTRRVERCAMVEVIAQRDRCFSECADHDSLLRKIDEMRNERERLEAKIRLEEPHLAAQDDLFADFRTWRYERSSNQEYLELRRELKNLQHALYNGSRLERILHVGVADLFYLAVPVGALAPDEIADGWGLLYVHSSGELELVVSPEVQSCTNAGRNHLALGIAEATHSAVLLANGVKVTDDGKAEFFRPIRRRKKQQVAEREQ